MFSHEIRFLSAWEKEFLFCGLREQLWLPPARENFPQADYLPQTMFGYRFDFWEQEQERPRFREFAYARRQASFEPPSRATCPLNKGHFGEFNCYIPCFGNIGTQLEGRLVPRVEVATWGFTIVLKNEMHPVAAQTHKYGKGLQPPYLR